MSGLSQKKCVPCSGGVPALRGEQIKPFIDQLNSWEVVDEHHLSRNFIFKDFVTALKFVNAIGEVAEAEGHHPDIYLTWGKVGVQIFTHKVDGLTESDFILAAKIDELPK